MDRQFNFWDSWVDITDIERRAIVATIRARDLVIKSVPKEVLVAIYIKGSFVRREMNEQSDVDMVPIVTQTKWESKVFEVNGLEVKPVMVVPLSLEEFAANHLETKSEESIDLRVGPDKFLRMIDKYKLVYGKPLNPDDFPIRTDEEMYFDYKKIIVEGYIPLFLKGEIDFSPLLKEFFWMMEMRMASLEIKVPHTFVGIAKGAKNDPLVREALRLRQKNLVDRDEQLQFVNRLREWVAIK